LQINLGEMDAAIDDKGFREVLDFEACRGFLTCLRLAAPNSMMGKLHVGVVFVGGDIFAAELAGLELALPHQHVEPEFDIVILVQRVLRQPIARPISLGRRSRRIVAPLLQYLLEQRRSGGDINQFVQIEINDCL
jgi:hypothetical protein